MRRKVDFIYPTMRDSLMAQLVKSLPEMWETGFDPWVGKMPWRRQWHPTPIFVPGESHGQRSLAGFRSWSHKELDMTEQLTHALPSRAYIQEAGLGLIGEAVTA